MKEMTVNRTVYMVLVIAISCSHSYQYMLTRGPKSHITYF